MKPAEERKRSIKVCHLITRLIIGGAQENTVYSVWGLSQGGRYEVCLASGPTTGPEGTMVPQVVEAGTWYREFPGLVREIRPAALLCVDSLCSSEPERLGRTLQFSDTGLFPAQPGHSRHLDAARLGVPVVAAGIPTLMQAEEGSDLVVTPRELDSVIAHGAALLAAAINRALQPHLSIAQLGWLTS